MAALQDDDIAAFFSSQPDKTSLRLVTCGSASSGKTTVVSRLLSESKVMQAMGTDTAMGTDMGMGVDVAHHIFATDQRSFRVADSPGHEQYTRNMATVASAADLAVILVDAHQGALAQTRRHSRIVAMLGIKHVVLAVNKMDLVAFNAATFQQTVADYQAFAAGFGFATLQAIPLSGLHGDNVLDHSDRMAWYTGPSLVAFLNTVDVRETPARHAFRMPVAWVNPAHLEFRTVCGQIAGGQVRPGDAVRVLPSGMQTRVKTVMAGLNAVPVGNAGDAVMLTLQSEVAANRGDVLAADSDLPEVADQFEARLLWMSEHAMVPGRQYGIKLASQDVTATVTEIKYREDVNTGAHLAARTLGLNDIASVNLSTSAPLVFEPCSVNRVLGSFTLLDKLTLDTVGAGAIVFALRRASNIHWQALSLNQATRAAQKLQVARCVWFTGLSGSGKSSIANLLDKRLHAQGRHTYLLDGDNLRHGLNRDLGFTQADRVENIRRVAEVARLMVDAGLIVLVSFISPFRSERQMARDLFAKGEFIEVFVDTPLQECEQRDVKGLYAKARRGVLKNFTGIDSPYEPPTAPELHLQTSKKSAQACAESTWQFLDAI